MNERIKELFNKAGLYAYEQNPGENSYGRPVDENKYEEDRYTKFAELIVRECMGFCKEVESDMDGLPTEGMRDIGSMGAKFCYEQIKQHFGVEE